VVSSGDSSRQCCEPITLDVRGKRWQSLILT
jgi:hypothetical protein